MQSEWTPAPPPPYMHPLIAAAFHNTTLSILCRLPDEVLVRIMQHSDRVTVECLRRCSRVFLRLFHTACTTPPSPASISAHEARASDFSMVTIQVHPWPTSRPVSKMSAAEYNELVSLLARDSYCSDCLFARQAPDWDARVASLGRNLLSCVLCNADHPACLFSARERSKKGEDARRTRKCIAHEGQVRLCDHVSVPWSVIQPEAYKRTATAQSRENMKERQPIIRCTHPSHSLRSCSYAKTGVDPPPPAPPPLRKTRHLASLFRSLAKRVSRTKIPVAAPTTPPAIIAFDQNPHCPLNPTISLAVLETNTDGLWILVVKLAWSGHTPMVIDMEGRDRLRADSFQASVQGLYSKQGRHICPRLKPGPAAGEGLCDPVRCDCLEYAGKEASGWHQPPEQWRNVDTCRTDRNNGLGYWGAQTKLLLSQKEGRPNSVFFKRQCFHQAVGTMTTTGFLDTQEADIVSCPQSPTECAAVNFASIIRVGLDYHSKLARKPSHDWYHALDPHSYGLLEDSLGFGVYWCRTEGCKNYYRYGSSRFKGVLGTRTYVHSRDEEPDNGRGSIPARVTQL